MDEADVRYPSVDAPKDASGILEVLARSRMLPSIRPLMQHWRPFRRRERAMLRFRRMKTLQKFASIHANVHNHINQERHLVDRQTYKERRSAALAEWQSLMV